MEWEFTPQQVVKAEADYGIDNFRLDLYREVQQNASTTDPAGLKTTFDLLFDLCYWLATDRGFDAFLAEHHHSPPVCEFLLSVRDAMTPNGEMLGAILQRMIMDHVEQGLTWEEGVSEAYRVVQQASLALPN